MNAILLGTADSLYNILCFSGCQHALLVGNLKTVFSGTSHTFNPIEYTNRYLAEFTCHFNRRFDLVATVTQLLRAAVNTNPLSLSKL